MLSFVMSWLAWLGLAVLITAVAAITGLKPKGTRHVARTRLMGAARLALLAVVIIVAYFAFRPAPAVDIVHGSSCRAGICRCCGRTRPPTR